jgi:hypothetical protein
MQFVFPFMVHPTVRRKINKEKFIDAATHLWLSGENGFTQTLGARQYYL